MQTATVLAAAGALLLLATGLAKLRRPAPTANALVALRWRLRVPAALALGGGEVVVGLLVLLVGGRVGPALACLMYAGFGGYVLRGLRTGISCGCSGHDDTPVTPLHLAVNVVFAAAALAAAVAGSAPLLRLPVGSLVAGAVLAVLLAAVGWLAVTVHPQLVAARSALRTP